MPNTTIGFLGLQLFCVDGSFRRVLIPDALFGIVYQGEAVDPHIPALLVRSTDIAYDGWNDGVDSGDFTVFPLSGESITIESSDQSQLDTSAHNLPRVRDYCPEFILGDRFPVAATIEIFSGQLWSYSAGSGYATLSALELATNSQVTLVADSQFRLTLVSGATVMFMNLSDSTASNEKRNHYSIYYAMGKQKRLCASTNHPLVPDKEAEKKSRLATAAEVPDGLSIFAQYILGTHADCSNSTYP